jgi:hypothetical protein
VSNARILMHQPGKVKEKKVKEAKSSRSSFIISPGSKKARRSVEWRRRNRRSFGKGREREEDKERVKESEGQRKHVGACTGRGCGHVSSAISGVRCQVSENRSMPRSMPRSTPTPALHTENPWHGASACRDTEA